MSHIDNILIQVRGKLTRDGIKLWLEPYYLPEFGCIEVKIDELAEEYSRALGITESMCKLALTELQDGALRKLAARKEYDESGIATFSVRYVKNREGTARILEIKCPINALGSEFNAKISEKLGFCRGEQIKCISGGKILDEKKSLQEQGIKNNQQLMAIISNIEESQDGSKYDRVRSIKDDVEVIVKSGKQFFEMEDQDGNPVFLPPDENRSLLMAMGLAEKARAFIKREEYDEALLLLLEADEYFNNCNSSFIDKIDNYALVNLDIVWCYLCLKNMGQLPDAERRLDICEKSFERSYGPNMSRLIVLKGNGCPERALLMRLHLLQAVVLFHQNRRNDAYNKLLLAGSELKDLKVDDVSLVSLIDMGFEAYEARMGLRASGGDIDQAVAYIYKNRETISENRKRSVRERKINRNLNSQANQDWVNPRSVCSLVEMGFPHKLVVSALKKAKNDLPKALDLLQNQSEELSKDVSHQESADTNFLEQLQQLGFDDDMSRVALETTGNDLQKAIDFIVKGIGNENELLTAMERMTQVLPQAAQQAAAQAMTQASAEIVDSNGPSTSNGNASSSARGLCKDIMEKMQEEMKSLSAYKRFGNDITDNEQGYLDLPLQQEEQILIEYKNLLEK